MQYNQLLNLVCSSPSNPDLQNEMKTHIFQEFQNVLASLGKLENPVQLKKFSKDFKIKIPDSEITLETILEI